LYRTSKSTLNRAGAALLAAGLTLTALAGCNRGFAAPEVNQGPRELGTLTAASFKGIKPVTVSIAFQNRAQLGTLVTAGMEIWYVDDKAKKAYGQISADQFPTVQKMGLTAKIVQGPGVFNDFDKGYHTYDQIKEELQALAAKHPEMVKFMDIGDGWQKSAGKGDRDILAIRIGKGDPSSKPAVLFCGNHHAREIVTPEMVLNIAHMLVNGYGKDPDLTNFVENRDIYLVPMVNPDGHKLASEGHDWRKNTNITTGGGTTFGDGPNGPGVDLNRNYGFKWGGPGAATRPTDATFRGPGAFSEPETQAIKNLVETRKFTMLMTYHSFSNLILWPWGHTNEPPPDNRLPAIGKKLGDLSGYKPEQSVDLYPTSGDTTDWAFGQHGNLAYTTEIGGWGDGFDPPYAKVAQFWKENEPGARLMLNLAGNPSHIFGPELKDAVANAGTVSAALPKGAVEAEMFIGRAGEDGTGTATAKADSNGRVAFSLPAEAKGRLVLVHARDAKGAWGPIKAVFGK
jgi:carboxypeptidase T